MDGAQGPAGPYRSNSQVERNAPAEPSTDQVRAHAHLCVRIPARVGGRNGFRLVADAKKRHSGAGLRRLSSDELRGLRHTRAPAHRDVLLGWSHGEIRGRDFYLRQLRDMKMSVI